ncbi:MAG: hypothetical protein FJY10_06440 [Bacteroidetes bacterium]|nr:hypothetical protein [Bacteroidota bacterium]
MLPDRIHQFIRRHHILTLSVTKDNIPWSCTCFYAFIPADRTFVITSDTDTRHIQDFLHSGNNKVAGTIALETKIIGKIRGIQFSATMREPQGAELHKVKKAYLLQFPFAAFTTLHLWLITPDYIKMTDNRLGFGKKLIWPENGKDLQ